MYEPIIDPMLFYWIDIASKLQDLPIVLAFLTGVSLCVAGLAYKDYSTEQNIICKCGKILSCIFILLFLISLPLSFFMPDKDTIYKMLIAKQVTPHNLQVTGDTVDKALDKIAEKIIKVTKEVKE